MDEMKKTAVQLPRGRQRPIKTEWNSRCVIFTYFQGDISSVVDEHFSRALRNIKRPPALNPSRQHEDVILRNDSGMPPNHWRFSSLWTKPQSEASLANGATSSSLNVSDPGTMDQYPLSLSETPSARPEELWHYSSLASQGSPEPHYSHAFPDGHLAPEPQADRKREPLLSLLQQDTCVNHPQEPAMREDCNPDQIVGSPGLFLSLPPSSAHCKKIYASPHGGPANPSLGNERSQSPERRKDLFFY
ncbi:transcription cofactor vestigial-like protein 1 isoform X1 [Castor canadensis]|uniref:Transcription cofactor vestigial-like protein 1 isoform X1 n=2 Tax=Castor canadensis TaxID=51338 RepID=A0AC58LNT7_CASCN